MRVFLLQLVVLPAYVIASSITGLNEKPSLPQCDTYGPCRPIRCNEDQLSYVPGKSLSIPGTASVTCGSDEGAGCKAINVTDPLYFLSKAIRRKYHSPPLNLSDPYTKRLLDSHSRRVLGRCRTCNDLPGYEKSCTTKDGQQGCKSKRLFIDCASFQPVDTKCGSGAEPCDHRGSPGCKAAFSDYCKPITYPSPTSTPFCQCPDGLPNGNQPGRKGFCDTRETRSGYSSICRQA